MVAYDIFKGRYGRRDGLSGRNTAYTDNYIPQWNWKFTYTRDVMQQLSEAF